MGQARAMEPSDGGQVPEPARERRIGRCAAATDCPGAGPEMPEKPLKTGPTTAKAAISAAGPGTESRPALLPDRQNR